MIQTLVVGSMATNCYIIDDIIIDPGDDAEYIISHVKKPSLVIATHGHFDHILAAFALTETYKIPFAMHKADEFLLVNMEKSAKHFLKLPTIDPPPKITTYLTDGDSVGNLRVLHTPGHTPGSVCFIGKDFVLSGDTLFAGGAVGRTDFSYSSKTNLADSIKRILSLAPSLKLLPGHGPSSSVKAERRFHRV